MITVKQLIEHLQTFPEDATIDENWFYGGGDCDCDLEFLILKDGRKLGDLRPLHGFNPYFQGQVDQAAKLREAVDGLKFMKGKIIHEISGSYDKIYVWTKYPDEFPNEFMGVKIHSTLI